MSRSFHHHHIDAKILSRVTTPRSREVWEQTHNRIHRTSVSPGYFTALRSKFPNPWLEVSCSGRVEARDFNDLRNTCIIALPSSLFVALMSQTQSRGSSRPVFTSSREHTGCQIHGQIRKVQ